MDIRNKKNKVPFCSPDRKNKVHIYVIWRIKMNLRVLALITILIRYNTKRKNGYSNSLDIFCLVFTKIKIRLLLF